MTDTLSGRLRDATLELHAQVERGALMRRLLRGELPQAGYALLLRNLHAVYEALEAGLELNAAHAALAFIDRAALARRVALEADLRCHHGEGWAQALPLLPPAQHYAAHLRTLAAASPVRLAAHAYVRYLGDLAGGQLLASIVLRAYRPAPGTGAAFYTFDAGAKALALAFRRGLDGIAGDGEVLVCEAVAAFERHRQLFTEIDHHAAARRADR